MKYIIHIAVIIILLGLNVGFFSNIKFFSGVPNLPLLYVIIVSLAKQGYDHIWIALVSGLLLDFYSGTFIGSFATAFVVLAIIVQALANRFLVLEISWKFLVSLVVGGWLFVYMFVCGYTFLAYLLGWAPTFVEIAIVRQKIIPEILYNLFLLFPLYWGSIALKQFIAQVTRRYFD